jgi:TIR domain
LSTDVMARIGFDEQRQLCETLRDDLNKCASSVDNEGFRAIDLELADEGDAEYLQAQGFSPQPSVNPDSLPFWTPGELRLFISHRDTHKVDARDLADALKPYGISAFVAHDTIEPMTTWQREIEKGLATMEVMVAFITDDFHDSDWTNQEVGIALGKSVPVIPVKFERTDPKGFIGPSVEGL